MIRHRLLFAVPFAVLLYYLIWRDASLQMGWHMAALEAALCTWALREFYRFCRTNGWKPFAKFGYVMCILLFFGHEQWCMETYHGAEALLPYGLSVLEVLAAIAVVGVFVLQVARRSPEQALGNISSTLVGLAYCFFLLSFMQKIRHLGLPRDDSGLNWAYDGSEFFFIFLTVTKVSDVGGLLVGSKLGKHKLCPSLSPKKTWEGYIGGALSSVVLLAAYCLLAPGCTMLEFGWPKIIGLGLILGTTSVVGDLAESAIKRDSQMKDAGTSVPGFGGVLDLIDSLMLTAPIMYYYLILVCGARPGA